MPTGPKTQVKDDSPSFKVDVVNKWRLSGVLGFLDKSVAAQIPHGAELAPIPYTGQNSCLTEDRTRALSQSLNSKHNFFKPRGNGAGTEGSTVPDSTLPLSVLRLIIPEREHNFPPPVIVSQFSP